MVYYPRAVMGSWLMLCGDACAITIPVIKCQNIVSFVFFFVLKVMHCLHNVHVFEVVSVDYQLAVARSNYCKLSDFINKFGTFY